ncbi:tetratricopeptide repeat protein [Butyrivibrio sp. MC2021]|uniref:tetratricopeptide repeat protein n=1 Tax=Butyrivibrio sp. MC2021 TaxID=1408306 RepID=UPI00047DD823|nr:tetratricopeptide repeat protein [Butyrivibrio sp. MC2021]
MGYRNKNVYSSAKRRKKKTLDIRRAGIITAASAVVVAAGLAIYSHLPFVKVNNAIAAGNKYTESANYEAAIESYEKAIAIDPKSVAAYSNLAGAYLSLDNKEDAKKALYEGFQNTDNELLLRDYHTVIMNEAVSDMNSAHTSFDTVDKLVEVLEESSDNADAIELLDAAYERCFNDSYNGDHNTLFRAGNDNFSRYSDLVRRMAAVYAESSSDALKNVILKYAVPNLDSFTMNLEDAYAYRSLLEEITASVGSSQDIDSVKNCISDAENVQGIFADIFVQLDVGNVDELRDFVVSDEYIALRNVFLNNLETPQENTTYVSISREAIILNRNENGFSYRFLNFEENPETSGVITLWANFFEDDGVQRNSISYEPGAINGNLYPHTKYSVTYLLSYITSGKSTKVAKMNYRLDTTITYEDGTTDETIVGDWGGPNEWIMDIDTIESRIRA